MNALRVGQPTPAALMPLMYESAAKYPWMAKNRSGSKPAAAMASVYLVRPGAPTSSGLNSVPRYAPS